MNLSNELQHQEIIVDLLASSHSNAGRAILASCTCRGLSCS